MHGHRYTMAAPTSAAAVGGRGGGGVGGVGGGGSGLGDLPNGAMSLHESFIYGGGGWQGAANYAVVAPHHRSVCRYSSYPGKPPANGSDNYEDVWASRTVAAAAAAASAAASAAAHTGGSAVPPAYSVGGHALLSRSKTWSPPDADSRPAVLAAAALATDETSSVSSCSEGSASSSCRPPPTAATTGAGSGVLPPLTMATRRTLAAEAGDELPACPDRDVQCSPHTAPPRLAPISGFLSPITEKGVLRPVACRPTPAARQNEYLAAPPKQTHPAQVAAAGDGKASCNSDEGYWSRETSRSSCASTPAAPRGGGGAAGLLPPPPPDGDDAGSSSGPPSPASRSPCAYGAVTTVTGPPAQQRGTPSSGEQQRAAAARDLELALRHREAEIESLRETLERNERAIFATFDERQASWQKQMRDLSAEYQRRLGAQQERAAKGEASLVAQVQRAQQEVDGLQDELRQCRARADDAERRVQLLLLRAGAADHDPAAASLVRLKADESAAVGSFRADADDKAVGAALKKPPPHKEDGKPTPPPPSGGSAATDECGAAASRAESERLRAELERRNCELKALRDGIESERQMWQQEKDKVIQYQKQLQVNYVHMYRKNAQLESELARLLGAESVAAAAAAAAQQPRGRDCVAAGRGVVAGPSLMLSFADNPESLC